MGVLGYGDRIGGTDQARPSGLYLLEGPGNDMVAVTNLAAAGCSLILFTTGRGTPLGSPVPVVKVSSNADLAERKRNWIDFDASPALDNPKAADADFFEAVLAFAEGRKTAVELRAVDIDRFLAENCQIGIFQLLLESPVIEEIIVSECLTEGDQLFVNEVVPCYRKADL